MKLALIAPQILSDVTANIAHIHELIARACDGGAEFILLPEAVLTGLVNNDDYAHDIRLAVPLDGQIIAGFRDAARKFHAWLCFGFFENDGCRIYDSAVLVAPNGEIALHYRRINPQWRDPNLPAEQYAEGDQVPCIDTPLGRTAIVICGDLFDDAVMAKLTQQRPDFVLFPFARCFVLTSLCRRSIQVHPAISVSPAPRQGGLV